MSGFLLTLTASGAVFCRHKLLDVNLCVWAGFLEGGWGGFTYEWVPSDVQHYHCGVVFEDVQKLPGSFCWDPATLEVQGWNRDTEWDRIRHKMTQNDTVRRVRHKMTQKTQWEEWDIEWDIEWNNDSKWWTNKFIKTNTSNISKDANKINHKLYANLILLCYNAIIQKLPWRT